MPSDLCSDDVVVCITTPQILMSESIVTSGAGAGAGAGARATSTATVELGRRLLLAARAGDTPLVLDLMARGAPFTTDWLGTSPLHLAAGNAHADTCAVLLRAGFSRDARTKVQRTPLHLAAYGGHAAVAALLLEAGAALECRDMLRMTPLHWAVQRGHARAAAELLRRGADPHALSKFHKSPASIAAELRRDDILKLIDDCVREREAARSVHALVHEQMADAPALEPQIQILDTVQRLEQVKPRHFEKKLKLDITHTDAGNMKRDDLLKLIEDAMQERGGAGAAAGAGEPAQYTVVDEQMSESPPDAPQLQAFDTIHRIQEVKIKKPKDRNSKMEAHTERSASGGSGSNAAAAAQLLRAHGITLLPADTGSTVLSALQSGRTVVLSDAGKLMLKESGEHPAASKSSASAPSSQAQGPGQAQGQAAGPAQGRGAAQGKGQGVVLTATPVTSPPRPGVKIFTINNKLLVPKDGHKIPVKKIINSHDMQVKFVHLPADAKIVSPSQLVPLKGRAKLAAAGPAAASPAAAVKIIMNKTNFTKLMANTTKPGVLHNGTEASPTSSTPESAPAVAAVAAESHVEAENVVCVPEEFLRSTSPRYLRAQLLAAHRALAALRADLHACKARLQHYERV